jgi:hypothetical protein
MDLPSGAQSAFTTSSNRSRAAPPESGAERRIPRCAYPVELKTSDRISSSPDREIDSTQADGRSTDMAPGFSVRVEKIWDFSAPSQFAE